MATSAHPAIMTDQLEQWMARLEASQMKIIEHLATHESRPWHLSFEPMNVDLVRRIERVEMLILSVGRWMIGVLFSILGALGAILVVAWRILDTKQP
jgi:hypothetical protein